MSQQFIGEIRLFPYNFAPKTWAYAAGQLLPIQQNAALFSLLGVQYGGNGVTTFALPDLRGRAIIGQGNGQGSTWVMGQQAGTEAVTLLQSQMPMHNHIWTASSAPATQASPNNGIFSGGRKPDGSGGQLPAGLYGPLTTPVTLAPTTLGATGGSQPHPNMQPYLALAYCVALQGIFPSRN